MTLPNRALQLAERQCRSADREGSAVNGIQNIGMAAMSDKGPRRQHKLPAGYQRRFGVDGEVQARSVDGKVDRCLDPRAIGAENDFYTVKSIHKEKDRFLETLFADHIEGPAYPFLDKLSAGTQLDWLERERVANFLALQLLRTDRFRERLTAFYSDSATIVAALQGHKVQLRVELENEHFMETTLETLIPIADRLKTRQWATIKFADTVLITSDEPMVQTIHGQLAGWLFPVDPWTMLHVLPFELRSPDWTKEEGRPVGVLLNQIVADQARRWIVHRPDQRPFIQRLIESPGGDRTSRTRDAAESRPEVDRKRLGR